MKNTVTILSKRLNNMIVKIGWKGILKSKWISILHDKYYCSDNKWYGD